MGQFTQKRFIWGLTNVEDGQVLLLAADAEQTGVVVGPTELLGGLGEGEGLAWGGLGCAEGDVPEADFVVVGAGGDQGWVVLVPTQAVALGLMAR
jgi:hypothetical protein